MLCHTLTQNHKGGGDQSRRPSPLGGLVQVIGVIFERVLTGANGSGHVLAGTRVERGAFFLDTQVTLTAASVGSVGWP